MHPTIAFSVVALTSCLGVFSLPADTLPSTGLTVADPPRPKLVTGYEEVIDDRGLSIKYTTIDTQVIPAFNFYPCLLELYGRISIKQSFDKMRDPFTCDLEGAQWRFEPAPEGTLYSGISRYIKGLGATIRKNEMLGASFEVNNRGAITMRGRVQLTGQTKNDIIG